MCLIITMVAAVITTLILHSSKKAGACDITILTLMYWGAALMWCVDGIFNIIHGEHFLEISLDDTILGIVIVICGILAWLVVRMWKKLKNRYI